jgi:small-conductance mechanosensitive channel
MALALPVEFLVDRLGRIVVPATVFVVATTVAYLPARYLLLPAAKRLLDAVGVDPAVELPVLKVFDATLAVLSVLIGASVSGLARFLAATAAITAGLTIALGFAARDVLGNLVSGVFIVLDPTFDIGDWIRWGDREGIIEDISFRVTRVHTFDNELVAVPNSVLATNVVENPSAKERLRLTLPVEVAIDNDLDLVVALLAAAARGHADVLDRPAPTARVRELVATTAVIDVRFWVERPSQADVVRVRSEFFRTAKRRLEANGIAFPSQDLGGEIAVRTQSDRNPSAHDTG